MTDLLLRIDGKFTASIPLLIKSSLMECVLASVRRRLLRTGLNNLYWAVSKIMAVTLYLRRFIVIVCGFQGQVIVVHVILGGK